MPRLLLFANTDWYLYNFRLPLAKELRAGGHEVILLSPPGDFKDRLQAQGFQWIPFPLSRQGVNPLRELHTLWRLIRQYREVRPDLVHHFTIKPVIYGSLAAHLLRIPGIINSITGLGHLFIDPGFGTRLLREVAKRLYRASLRDSQIIFENPEDRQTFTEHKIIGPEQAHLIVGTGVDIGKFRPVPKIGDVPLILFSGRFLATKGLAEFMEAARMLKQKRVKARFAVAGTIDPGNPASIPQGQLDSWQQAGLAEWWGWQEDMPSALAKTDIFCLPSYREGVPNALLEACASGLPIVTTDVPGCREVVQHGVNGFLVPPRDAVALANALEELVSSPQLRSRMGAEGRGLAVEHFSLSHIVSQNMEIYEQVLNRHR